MRPLLAILPVIPALLVTHAYGSGGNVTETPAIEEEGTSSLSDLDFDKGLKVAIADGDITVKFGGRVMYDFGFLGADSALDANVVGWEFNDGSEFRRARLYAKGTLYDTVDFKANYDFAGGDADFKDVYMQVGASFGKVRVGHFKEPFGLEELTSSKYITFNERSVTSALVPARNGGVMLFDSVDGETPYTWAAGLFRTTDNFGDDTVDNDPATPEESGAYNCTVRVTAAPVMDEEGEVLHLGLAASMRTNDDGNTNRFRTRPENHFSASLADTLAFDSDGYNLYGLEAAWSRDSLSLQGEYMLAEVDRIGASNADFSAFYLMLSYFVTGEQRPYDQGVFGRVKPNKNMGQGGSGAWELTARLSSVDLNSEGVTGGELRDITGGVNWYLNPNARVMFNYVHSELDDSTATPSGDGGLDAVLLRFQFDF